MARQIYWNCELYHYGMPRRSGRYPFGSGEKPYQHSGKGGKKQQLRNALNTKAILVTGDTDGWYTMHNDYKIPKGSVLSRIGSNAQIKKADVLYTTLFRNDWKSYDNDEFFESGKFTQYKTKKDIQIASGNKVIGLALSKMGHDELAKDLDLSADLDGAISKIYPNKTEAERKIIADDIYKVVDLYRSPYRKQIVDDLKKLGYTGCVDPVDTSISYSASPTVIFDPEKNVKQVAEADLYSKKFYKLTETKIKNIK